MQGPAFVGSSPVAPPLGVTTITVSGYDPVVAYCSSGAAAKVSQADELGAFAFREAQAVHGRSGSAVSRCHGCNVWKPRTELADTRLGFDAYCDGCIREAAERCLSRHGRLPQAGEFFCLGCEFISDRSVQAKPDADGRRRSRCVLCRQGQVRAAEVRRRRREFVAVVEIR